MATALSTEIQERIVAETGSAAPSTDDAVAFESWLDGIKESNSDLFAGVATEIESLMGGKVM
ncbi:hypothetical protein ACFRJ1_30730 [Streptomyces sp. NPDC056773]|uniref:hypothetical protein n=1 Tax=unclassified Streptomyces TaxID=2593676 RepID=UPI0036C302CD